MRSHNGTERPAVVEIRTQTHIHTQTFTYNGKKHDRCSGSDKDRECVRSVVQCELRVFFVLQTESKGMWNRKRGAVKTTRDTSLISVSMRGNLKCLFAVKHWQVWEVKKNLLLRWMCVHSSACGCMFYHEASNDGNILCCWLANVDDSNCLSSSSKWQCTINWRKKSVYKLRNFLSKFLVNFTNDYNVSASKLFMKHDILK